jgi:uncharacterized protein
MATDQVTHNEGSSRFELEVGGLTAVAEYVRNGNVLRFTHTEVPHEHRNQGVGHKLIRGALDQVRGNGDRVVAQCPFVARFIRENPEYQDLLSSE